MKWSKEQQFAIDERGRNMLISAGAGAGKTSVLVERIRKLVSEDMVPIREFLIVTFTNAAAAEMKERLRASLTQELQIEDPKGEKARYLKQQVIDLETANISTFHAFGLSVIRRFFYKLDIEPGFSMADEIETGILKDEAMEVLLEEEFESFSKDFIDFMDAYSGDRNDYSVRTIILEAHEKLLAMPNPWEWTEDAIKGIEEAAKDFNASSIWQEIRKDILNKAKDAETVYLRAATMLDDMGYTKLARDIMEAEVAKCRDIITVAADGSKHCDGIIAAIDGILARKGSMLKPSKEEKEQFDLEARDAVGKLKQAGKDLLTAGIQDLYIHGSIEEAFSTSLEIVPFLRTLLRLVMRFDELYKELKKEQNIMDFSDLEHYCYQLLGEEEIAGYYRDTISQIFIDEYQDTNLMQEAIIERVCRPNNLFMVGDIKQSIYRFRLADPDIFKEKYESYQPWDGVSSGGSDPIAVNLNENHRSKEPIIDYVNKIFRPLMEGYDKRAELSFFDDPESEYGGELDEIPKLHVVMPEENLEEEDQSVDYEEMETAEIEAHYVASLIKENLGKPFYDSKANPPGPRPLEEKDIVILRRSVTTDAMAYISAFKEEGLNLVIQGDDGYFETMEIMSFMDLLTVINNLHRDVALVGVLHSEVFDFSAEELARIRITCKKGSFADCFISFVKGEAECSDLEDDGSLASIREKAVKAYNQIIKWREMSRSMGLADFVWELMLDSGLYVIMGGLPNGTARQANLRAICDMADRYAKGRQATLFDFLKYVDSIKAGDIKVPEAEDWSQAGNTIRMMTIHKSKGLEFPMVILTGIYKGFRTDASNSFLMHKDIGVGLKYVNRKKSQEARTIMQTLIKSRCLDEDIEEEIRVLYVALTRARDRLFLVGYKTNDNFTLAADMGEIEKKNYLTMVAGSVPYEIVRPFDMANNDDADDSDSVDTEPKDGEVIISKEEIEEIIAQLNFSYPHIAARSLKSKYSVSELNRKESPWIPPELARKSSPAKQPTKLTAAERGTVYHKIMEVLRFKDMAEATEEEVRGMVLATASSMVEDGLITEEAFREIDLDKISNFFMSDLGKRASKADALGLLEKERAFTLRMDMETETATTEKIMVQGIIDCYFREGEGKDAKTVLIDYKSNWIDPGKPIEEEEERLRRDYALQLKIYKAALDAAGLGPVEEAYLYLLDADHGFLI